MLKKYLADALMALLVVLAPIKAVIITVGVLIVADLIMGIWAAYKRGEEITSRRMSQSILKAIVYQVAVITGFLVEKYLMDGFIPVTKIVGSMIGLVELKSLMENSGDVLGQPVFQMIISQLQREAKEKLQVPSSPPSSSDEPPSSQA